jgi:hypothetical protein
MYANYLAQQMPGGEGAPAPQEAPSPLPAPATAAPAMMQAAPRRRRLRIDPAAAAATAQAANDAHIRESIAAKVTRAQVLGIRDDSLLGLEQLARVGINPASNEQGLPYGLDLGQLNGVERRWLQRRTQ